MVTQEDRDQAKYEERFKAELDARSFLFILEDDLRRDILMGRIHFCQKLLRQPLKYKDELILLSVKEMEQLAERLEQQAIRELRPTIGTPDPEPTSS